MGITDPKARVIFEDQQTRQPWANSNIALGLRRRTTSSLHLNSRSQPKGWPLNPPQDIDWHRHSLVFELSWLFIISAIW